MLRSRRKNVRKKNARNTRNRNEWKLVSEDDELSASDFWESPSSMSELDSEDANLSNCLSLEPRRKRPVRKIVKRKTRANALKRKSNANDRDELNEAGPSCSSNTSNNSRVEAKNGTAKRKLKERKHDILESDSSSDDIFGRSRQRSNFKRIRTSDLDSDDSESSGIRPVSSSSQRQSLFNSESSTSGSEIRRPIKRRNAVLIASMGSDSESSNTLDQSSNSPIFNTARLRAASSGSSSGNLLTFCLNDQSASSSSMSSSSSSSSSSTTSFLSTSSFSLDSNPYNTGLEANAFSSVKSATAHEQLISSDSDSSDSDGEKCAICLKLFRRQQIGNPSNCDHKFCVTCIQEWSKSSTTCPVDRSVFDAIIVRNELDGPVVDRIEVQNRNFGSYPFADIEEFIINDSIACEICLSGDDEETLLLCDTCNLGYHMACLTPPLDAIPAGSWHCPTCRELHNDGRSLSEATRHLFSNLPLNLAAFPPRSIRTLARTARTRPAGPPPRGRGPTLSRRMRSHVANSTRDMIASVLENRSQNQNVPNELPLSVPSARQRIKSRKRNRRRAGPQVPRNRVQVDPQRISSRNDEVVRTVSLSRPSAVVEMLFPSFNLFDNDADYFSEDDADTGLDGEVAIMARVRSEYSARRVENRKNIVSSLMNDYSNRRSSPIDVPEMTLTAESSVSLLDSILESQTLWHSKNVEIKAQKDGKLDVRLKNEVKKPDLSNTNHTSKEIPLYPGKSDNNSSNGNKSYTNNTRYSNNLGNSSGGGSNSFPLSSSSFSGLNPSTRPGFSNILGNSSALDLSPFRGTAPIRFRMNPPRPALRRQNYNNANSMRLSATNSALNLSQSPRKSNSSSATGGEDDVDLYDDIESENVESDKMPEAFSSLEPPPEPPALLIGSDSSSDEDNGLVIDDKAANSTNKSNIYDPTEPNDSDVEGDENNDSSIIPGYLRSPSYGGLSEFGPHLPLPEPPALPIELNSVDSSDDDDDDEAEAECPNMTLYSSTSINLASSVQDIPIPPSQQDDLDCIPIPSTRPSDKISLPEELQNPAKSEELPSQAVAMTAPPPFHNQLYSPSAENDADSDSSDLVEEVLPSVTLSRSSPKQPPRRHLSTSPSSLGSTDEEDISSDDEFGLGDDDGTDEEEHRTSDPGKKVAKMCISVSNNVSVQSEKVRLCGTDDNVTVDLTETKDSVTNVSKTDSIEVDDNEANIETEGDEVGATSEDVDESKGEDDENEKDDKDDDDGVDVATKNDVNESEENGDADSVAIKATEQSEAPTEQVEMNEEDEMAEKSAPGVVVVVAEGGDADTSKELTETAISNACLLPSDDLDPVSDVEYNDFTDYQKHSSSTKERRKKRKKTKKRDASADSVAALTSKGGVEARELEEGEIADDKSKKRKYDSTRKHRRSRSVSDNRFASDRKLSKRRNRRGGGGGDRKASGKENKDSGGKGGNQMSTSWKKLSKSTKERNYRDGKPKETPAEKRAAGTAATKAREARSKKEKRKEIERYDVRKIVAEKPPRPMRDEFGRDISPPRSKSRSRSAHSRSRSRTRSRSRLRSVSPARSYSDRRRSKGGPVRRSFSQDDRWIDWSPVWTQQHHRSRSRTRRSRSRSRNRSRLSNDRYRNRSKTRVGGGGSGGGDRAYEKRGGDAEAGAGRRKRRRSLSSNLDRYSPLPQAAAEKKRRRSKEQRVRKSASYSSIHRHGGGGGGGSGAATQPEYFYEQRSWSPDLSYASVTPEGGAYVARYERSPQPSLVDAAPASRVPVVSPDEERDIMAAQNPQNLTVIVPNVDAGKKKHKKKKDGKKKKKKQPSKEVFTSGDNIVVSVNFDDNQKTISAKSSKRKRDDGSSSRKKKKDEARRKRRKQNLHVSDEVLNAKPVAVIDLNTSPCKEMSPTEVISLTDSGDETNANEGVIGGSSGVGVISVVRRTSPKQYGVVVDGGAVGFTTNEGVGQTPDTIMSYVMTSAGPKTPPEPPIKFAVGTGTAMRPLPTNPIFEQDEELENEEEAVHYNKGPNTPPEPLEQQRRRSDSPGATMYDPFEPTKSRTPSPTPGSALYDKTSKDGASSGPVVIDMFADDGADKSSTDGGGGGDASAKKGDVDTMDGKSPAVKTSSDDASQSSKTSPALKEMSGGATTSGGDGSASIEQTQHQQQSNGMNTLVLDLSSLGDDFVPRSSVPLIKTSQGKYEFQSSKTADKPVTVVIAPQSSAATVKPLPQQVMVTPTRQLPMKPVEPIKQPMFPDILPWKLPPPMSSQPSSFAVPSTMVSSVAPTLMNAGSKSMPGMLLTQNGAGGGAIGDDVTFELDDSPYSPASSEGDDLFEPPPLNSNASIGISPNKVRGMPLPMPAVNSYKARVDSLFNSSPAKKLPHRSGGHMSRPISAFKTSKKATKTVAPSKKDSAMKADEEQLKILDDVPNSAVEMIVKEKFLKKLHRQERVVEEVKVVLKPHYAKKHITKEEYKDVLRKAVPKICHNKSGDINPSKIQSLVEAYVRKIRHLKRKKPANSLPNPTSGPLFPSMTGPKTGKKQKTTLWS